MLWQTSVARLVLNPGIRTKSDVMGYLGKLTVRYATPLDRRQLDAAERALLFSCLARFGEPPPLNFNLSGKWDSEPLTPDLRWAEKGVLRRGYRRFFLLHPRDEGGKDPAWCPAGS